LYEKQIGDGKVRVTCYPVLVDVISVEIELFNACFSGICLVEAKSFK